MIFMFINQDETIYIYKKYIFEGIIAKYMERIKDFYILPPIFLS